MPKPSHTQVLVKIAASAIHPSDILSAKGGFPYTTFPRIPGRDFAGTIVMGPSDQVGKAVYGPSGCTHSFSHDGFQAEYATLPLGAFTEKPAGLGKAQAATVGIPYTTADLLLQATQTKK